jgi:hypothetical protein
MLSSDGKNIFNAQSKCENIEIPVNTILMSG